MGTPLGYLVRGVAMAYRSLCSRRPSSSPPFRSLLAIPFPIQNDPWPKHLVTVRPATVRFSCPVVIECRYGPPQWRCTPSVLAVPAVAAAVPVGGVSCCGDAR